MVVGIQALLWSTVCQYQFAHLYGADGGRCIWLGLGATDRNRTFLLQYPDTPDTTPASLYTGKTLGLVLI